MRELLDVDTAHDAHRDLRPLLARKNIERGQSHLKQQLARRKAQPLRPALRLRGRPRPAAERQCRIDHGAACAGRDRVALAGQHLVGDLDRAACDAQLACERAGGGQTSAGGEPPGEDLGAQSLIDVAVERMVRARWGDVVLPVHD